MTSAMSKPDSPVPDAADEAAIRLLADHFVDAVNRLDWDLFASLWTADAEWVVSAPVSRRFCGEDAIRNSADCVRSVWSNVIQMTTCGVVEVRGQKAYSRFYVSEVEKGTDGHGYYNLAVYNDVLVRVAGEWYFLRREYSTIMAVDAGTHAAPMPALADESMWI